MYHNSVVFLTASAALAAAASQARAAGKTTMKGHALAAVDGNLRGGNAHEAHVKQHHVGSTKGGLRRGVNASGWGSKGVWG